MSSSLLATLASAIDVYQPSLWLSVASITFNPLAWNIVAQNEYHNKTITRIFGGNTRDGCYFLAVMIFSFGILRDHLYQTALQSQPVQALLPEPFNIVIPVVLFVIGQTFVITSTYRLGITGTFLGDYFGILMDARVEGFPFNVVRDPMYVGSTMCFAGAALWYERPAGLLITLYVWIIYTVALRYEGPFTDMIYSKRYSAASFSKVKKEL